jgi:hypothetical protein
LIDIVTGGWCFLAGNTPPSHHVSATLELARKERWATSGPDHQVNHRIRTSRFVILHMYYEHNTRVLTRALSWTVHYMHSATRVTSLLVALWPQVKFEVATHQTFLFKRGRRKGEVDEPID